MDALGDKIAYIAQPVARGLDAVFGTGVAGCAGCKQMQHNLNAGMSLADAFYDRFWKTKNQTMQYIINKTQTEQIAIEAENPKEALQKVRNGEGTVTSSTENFSATPRPQPPPTHL